jgi:dienelactone hydrolase
MRFETIEFPGEGAVSPLRVPGKLRIVEGRAVVVVAHGSSGPDSRGRAYAEAFAAHAALYPVCWLYNSVPGYEFRDLTGAPILLQCGAADDYDAPDAAQMLAQSLDPSDRASLNVVVYPGATHAFDSVDEPARVVTDPLARQGRGGEVAFTPDPEGGAAARRQAAEFFRRTLNA